MNGKKGHMKKGFIAAAVLALGFLAGAAVSDAAKKEEPSHMDGLKNPAQCGGCHRGKGVPGTPMLSDERAEVCFGCHGNASRGLSKNNIERELMKRSAHPIKGTSRYHSFGESLPETDPRTQRHVACEDCHAPHISSPSEPMKGARGLARGKPGPSVADEAYETCYLCHSESMNKPAGSRNMKELFDPMNQSYHPVEEVGRNPFVPSLMSGLTVNSRIGCLDCHGNNNTAGPKGPHGSDYPPLLLAQYRIEGGSEGPKAYELCYMCHDRRSILRDESFKYHTRHIVFAEASCSACHNPHGSSSNKHLIEFDKEIAAPLSGRAEPEYLPMPIGKCFLRCHEVNHDESGVARSPWRSPKKKSGKD